ncbi:DUF2785 domain-containing protein [Halobacillus litoralis]|uniref:DUF2785 domain-containing protein n=1 Tax=Halobacillus litoralis TaxID=45668 RepID=UPI001CFD3E8B|nr:DUF2785 domain-containing protein [Halobacillus litoralis]
MERFTIVYYLGIHDIDMKEKIRTIIKGDNSQLEQTNAYEVVKQITAVLGSPDPELRDELGYQALIKLLIQDRLLNTYELQELMEEMLSEDKLFYRIGEEGEDSVFLRSFSSLVLALLIHRDQQEPFLSRPDFTKVVESLARYCHMEKDYRGFVEGKGWAHAPAHISDVMDECVIHRYSDVDVCRDVWEAMKQLVLHAPRVFDAEEEERMATAVCGMVGVKGMTLTTLKEWTNDLASSDYELHTKINVKNFVRSVGLRLLVKEPAVDLREWMIELETTYNPGFSQQ